MSNSATVTERLTKLPRILPKPTAVFLGNPVHAVNPVILVPTNSTQILTASGNAVNENNAADAKKRDAATKRKVIGVNQDEVSPTKHRNKKLDTSDTLQNTEFQSSDSKYKTGPDLFSPTVCTNKRLDMLDSLQKAMEAEHQSLGFQSETPQLPYLIETYQHWSHKMCLYEHGSRSYRRVEAVRATMSKYDVRDCLYECSGQDMLDKFFEYLESFCCFNEGEITAFKQKLYMVHSEHWRLQKKRTTKPSARRTCPYCHKFKTEDVGPLWQHVIKNHIELEKASKHKIDVQENKLFCTHCFQTGFERYHDVLQHETRVHGIDTKNSCPFCGFTCGYNDVFELNQHVIAIHGLIFQCSTCKEEFCDRNDLNAHTKFLCANIEKTDLVQKYFCPFCNLRFSSYEEVFKHLYNTYNASKPRFDRTKGLKCFTCELKFDTHVVLERHLKDSKSCCCAEFHSVSNKHVQCFSCKQMFQSKEALEFHQSAKARWLMSAPCTNRPLNFKSQKFKVTCDIKRLTRSDLANYPKALNRMLQAFEVIHSTSKDKSHFTDIITVREDSMSPKLSNNKRITEESDVAGSKPSKEAVGSVPLQYNTTPLTISDRSGNTVVINNQQGGSNTIILGNYCSGGHQVCSKQQSLSENCQNIPGTSHSQTDMPVDKMFSPKCNEHLGLDRGSRVNENAVVNCGIVKEKNMSSSQKKCLPESVIKEDEEDNQTNDFKAVSGGRIEENCSNVNMKKAKHAMQDHDSILRGIVREELRKYLESVEEKAISAASVQIRTEGMMNSSQPREQSSLKKQSEVGLTDKNSMQQLYGVKSEPLEYVFERNENQLQSEVDKEQGKMNNESLLTEIKMEPISPSDINLDTNCHSSHTFDDQSFILGSSVHSATTAVSFSKPSASQIHSELNVTVDPVMNEEPPHVDARKNVALSSVVQSPTQGAKQNMISGHSLKPILPKKSQPDVTHSDEIVKIVQSKTVGCLLPMAAKSGYLAHLYEPSVSAASFLCNQRKYTPILPQSVSKVTRKHENIVADAETTKIPPKIQTLSSNKDESEKSNTSHCPDVLPAASDSVQHLTKKTVSTISTTVFCASQSLPGLSTTKVSTSKVISSQDLAIEPTSYASTTQSIVSVTSSGPQVVSYQITNPVSTSQAMSSPSKGIISTHQTFQGSVLPMAVPQLVSVNSITSLPAKASNNVPISGQNLYSATSSLSSQSLATASTTQPAQNIIKAATSQVLPILNVPSLSTNYAGLSFAPMSISQVVKGQSNAPYQVLQMQPQKVPIYSNSGLENVTSKKTDTHRFCQAESDRAITDCSTLTENSKLGEENNKSLNVNLCGELRFAGKDEEINLQDLTVIDSKKSNSEQGNEFGDTKTDNGTHKAKTIGSVSSEQEKSGSKTDSSPMYACQEDAKMTDNLQTVLYHETLENPQETVRAPNQSQATFMLPKQTSAAEVKVEPMQFEEDSASPSQGHGSVVQQPTGVKNLVQPVGMQQNLLTTVLQPNSVPQNIVPVLQNTAGQGKNIVFINQGTPVAVQQNPWVGNSVINTGLQQNFLSPVKPAGMQPGQVLQQPQMFYQAVQTPQGPVVIPQCVNTGSGFQSGPMMFVGQPQMLTGGTQIPAVSSSQSGPKLFIGQQQLATTGTQNQSISGSQTGPFVLAGQPQMMSTDTQSQLGSSSQLGPLLLPKQQQMMATGTQNQSGSFLQPVPGLFIGQQEMVKKGAQNQPVSGSQSGVMFSQSGPMILVRQQQAITTSTQNQAQYVLTGCQANPVTVTGQNLVTLAAKPKRGKRKKKLPLQRQKPRPIKAKGAPEATEAEDKSTEQQGPDPEEVRGDEASQSVHNKGKGRWSFKQDLELVSYFLDHIQARRYPTLEECRGALKEPSVKDRQLHSIYIRIRKLMNRILEVGFSEEETIMIKQRHPQRRMKEEVIQEDSETVPDIPSEIVAGKCTETLAGNSGQTLAGNSGEISAGSSKRTLEGHSDGTEYSRTVGEKSHQSLEKQCGELVTGQCSVKHESSDHELVTGQCSVKHESSDHELATGKCSVEHESSDDELVVKLELDDTGELKTSYTLQKQ